MSCQMHAAEAEYPIPASLLILLQGDLLLFCQGALDAAIDVFFGLAQSESHLYSHDAGRS